MAVQVPRGVRRRIELLQHEPDLPAEVLEELANDSEVRVRFWLARRWDLPSDLVASLRGDASESVRMSLIMNSSIALERAAVDYARSEDVVVRRSIARRPGIGGSVLGVLIDDDDVVVRGFVARHEDLDEAQARRLIDDDWSVRANLTAQLGRWNWLDERLEADPDPCVNRLVGVAKESPSN